MSERDEVALKGVRTWLDVAALRELTDVQLLAPFVAGGGEAAELAFAALVARHGPMVLRACCAVLRNGPDVEDAFQATFLVLVRRDGTLWVRESLGPWLHRVASRVATRVQIAATRRQRHERHAAESRVGIRANRAPDDFAPIIHAEIDRLPERSRGPVVLCDLEGHTHEQAAELLGCSPRLELPLVGHPRNDRRINHDRSSPFEPADPRSAGHTSLRAIRPAT